MSREKMFSTHKALVFSVFTLVFLTLISFSGNSIAEEKETVLVVVVQPQSGPSATWGVLSVEGVRLGVEQINAAGGLLGKQLRLEALDDQSKPAVSVAAMKKAVGLKPYVVFGTNMSSSTLINMSVLEEAGIPQFSGSTSPKISQQGNRNIFMACMNADNLQQKSKDWLINVVRSRKMAVIYVADEMGKATLDSLVEVLKGTETKMVEVRSSDVGQADYTGDLVKIDNSGADTLYIIQRCDEIARILLQCEKLGLNKKLRIVGTETLIGPDTIRLAKTAAEGMAAIADLTYKTPSMWPMAVAYKGRFGRFPGHDAIKAYLSVMIVATATEEVGAFDQQRIKDFLHNRTLCTKKYRWMPIDVHYDKNGILDRECYELMVKNGDQVVNKVLSPVHPENFQACK